jgi:RNA polymerase sigma factor (sigma-70 family)
VGSQSDLNTPHPAGPDAVQEAALVAWLNLSKLRRADRFGPWLAGIGLRVCHSWLRYRAREAWSLDALLGGRVLPEPIDWSATPLVQAEESELNDRVRRAVADLPRGQRAAVTLFYLADLSHLETAELLGIHVGARRAYTRRAPIYDAPSGSYGVRNT